MQNIIAFLIDVKTSFFNQLNATEQALAILAVAGPALTILWALRNYYLGRNKNLAVELAEEKEASQRWLKKFNDASERLADAEAALPSGWLKDMAKERRDGNEERAIGRLRDSFRAASPDLALAAEELAEYHFSAGFDLGHEHFAEARRYSRLAVLLGAQKIDNRRRLDELATLDELPSSVRPDRFAAWDDLHEAYATGPEAIPAIDRLNDAVQARLDEGHYAFADALNRRARIIAARAGLPPHEPAVLTCRFYTARVLDDLGRYDEALAEIDAFAPIEARARGEDDPNVLVTRLLRADALDGLARYTEALAEIDAFAPIAARVLGKDHSDVFVTRLLRARILNHLGRHDEAMADIDTFAQAHAKALGEAHPDVLATRGLRALVLDNLGRHDEALAEVDAFAPKQAGTLVESHPAVIRTQWLRAKVLHHVGRSTEAMALIESVVESQLETLGPQHRWTRESIALHDEIGTPVPAT